MELDYKAALFWVSFANFVWMVGLTIYVRYSNRNTATAASITALTESIVSDRMEIEKRFAHVEAELARRVTHDDIAAVYDRVNHVANVVSALEGQVRSMSTSLQMIHEHLLSQGNAK